MTIRGHSVPLTLCEHCFSHKSNAVADPHGLATARWAPSGPCFVVERPTLTGRRPNSIFNI